MKTLKAQVELSDQIDAAQRQILLFQRNKTCGTPIPEKLAGRVAYLKGYMRAVRELENLERLGTLDNHLHRIKQELKDGYYVQRGT